MLVNDLLKKITDRLFTRWVACRLVSDNQSVQYGIYFSYPLYIIIVFVGTLFANSFILLIAALIAFFGIKLPMHPFDYIYNRVAKLIGANAIPGRGSELQVNSIVALVFNLVVFALINLGISINFTALGILYVLSSIFFIGIFLFKE